MTVGVSNLNRNRASTPWIRGRVRVRTRIRVRVKVIVRVRVRVKVRAMISTIWARVRVSSTRGVAFGLGCASVGVAPKKGYRYGKGEMRLHA